MDHTVNLTDIQQVVMKYVDQYHLVKAAGPMTGAMLVKTFVSDSKPVNLLVVSSGIWFAVQELSGPMIGLFSDQFGYLQQILGMIKQ